MSPMSSSKRFGVFGSCWTRIPLTKKEALLPPVRDLEVRVVPSVSGSGALLLAASIISAYFARGIRGKYSARASGLDFAKHGFGVFGQQQVGAFGRDAIKVRDRRVDFSRLGL